MRHFIAKRGHCDTARCRQKAVLSIGDKSTLENVQFCMDHAKATAQALVDGINEIEGTALVIVELDPDEVMELISEEDLKALELKGVVSKEPQTEGEPQTEEPSDGSQDDDDIPGLTVPVNGPQNEDKPQSGADIPDFMKQEEPKEKTVADPHNLVDLGSLADLTKEQLLEIVVKEGVKTRAASVEGLVIAITTHREAKVVE